VLNDAVNFVLCFLGCLHYFWSVSIHLFCYLQLFYGWCWWFAVRQSWSEPAVKGTPPTPRDSHSCSVVGDSLFVFGGTDGTRLLNDLHILDTCESLFW